MSNIYLIRTESNSRIYNTGVKITTDAEGHTSIDGGSTQEEIIDTLLTDFENRTHLLLENENTLNAEGERVSQLSPIQATREFHALLEIKNRLESVPKNSLSASIQQRLQNALYGREWQALSHRIRLSCLDSFQRVPVPVQFSRLLGNDYRHSIPASVRFHTHSLLYESIAECQRALQNARSAASTQEQRQYLLDAIRFYRRAYFCEENLVAARSSNVSIHTIFGEQLQNLKNEISHFEGVPRELLINLPRPSDEQGWSNMNRQHDYQSLLTAARFFISFVRRITPHFPLQAQRYLELLESFIHNTLPQTQPNHFQSQTEQDLRNTLAIVQQLKNSLPSHPTDHTPFDITQIDMSSENQTLQQLLSADPHLLPSNPFLLTLFPPSQIERFYSRVNGLIIDRNLQALWMRTLSPGQLDAYLSVQTAGRFLEEEFAVIPFASVTSETLNRLLRRDNYYFLTRTLQNRNLLIQCLDQVSTQAKTSVWNTIINEPHFAAELRALPNEVRDICQSYEGFRNYLNEAGILGSLNLDRISLGQWLQLAYNYHHLRELAQNKPIALITISRARDENRAVQNTEANQLSSLLNSNRFTVIYIPIDTDTELHSALTNTVDRAGRRIQKWFISAHGEETTAWFGSRESEVGSYDISDFEEQFLDLPNFFESDAEIVHNVCSNGGGREDNSDNIINREANLFRRREQAVTIHSMSHPGYLQTLSIQANGQLSLTWDAENEDYTVRVP